MLIWNKQNKKIKLKAIVKTSNKERFSLVDI